MKRIKYISPVLIILTALIGCKKIESLPDTPFIEFTSFIVFDTTDILGNTYKGGRLNFYFEDGDGDLGLKQPSSNYSDTSNLFFKLYKKTAGQFAEVPEDDFLNPSDYRIPFMDREGQNKILKGTITVSFLYTFYDVGDTDTVKYEFFVKDRALNTSNTDTTCEIPLSFNGIYTFEDSL
ncbi:MAG TPA: hypothetical protein P5180_03635 [Bacteroidales bacterium]|nr:hypothetical protein [Bacteroidales bacterium]HPJ58089.1 hypothetical protein [Bacteroidales bacterium]HRW84499.1 hypothetical protein [Bacteroidales bacterium]